MNESHQNVINIPASLCLWLRNGCLAQSLAFIHTKCGQGCAEHLTIKTQNKPHPVFF